jgi:transporter family-2 protein
VPNALFLILAFVSGSALATQAVVNSQLAAAIGGAPVAAAFLSFVVGTVALGILAASTGGLATELAQVASQPLWRLTGGLLGAGAVYCATLLAPRIGLAPLYALVIAGQLLTSIVIDNFGTFGMPVRPATTVRIVGAVVMLIGVLIALFGDRLTAARH